MQGRRYRWQPILLAVSLAGVALASATLASAAPATTPTDAIWAKQGTPTSATLEQIITTLGVDQTVADYAVVVDTSGSMEDGGLYSQVKVALGPFLQALSPSDHLSLLTFDTTPNLAYSGDVGQPADRALGQLPDKAVGKHTDIGDALDASLQELERRGANTAGAIVFITDGLLEAPGSRYADPASDAWNALTARAAKVTSDHTINAYAIGLRGQTDAGLVKQVFPSTLVVSLPQDQIKGFLGRVKDEVRLAKARQLLAPDMKAAVTASFRGGGKGLNLKQGRTVVPLTLVSTLTHVPVSVGGMTAKVTGIGPVKVEGLPNDLTLKPGETKTLPVTVRLPAVGGFGIGQNAVRHTGELSIACQVSSPWQDALTKDLGLVLTPQCSSPVAAVTATVTSGWSYLKLVLAILLPVLIGLVLIGYRRSKQPILRGALLASLDSQPPARATLIGRQVKFGKGTTLLKDLPGTGQVRGRYIARPGKRSGKDIGLVITYEHDKTKQVKLCKPNSSTTMDSVTFSYQSLATRNRSQ